MGVAASSAWPEGHFTSSIKIIARWKNTKVTICDWVKMIEPMQQLDGF